MSKLIRVNLDSGKVAVIVASKITGIIKGDGVCKVFVDGGDIPFSVDEDLQFLVKKLEEALK